MAKYRIVKIEHKGEDDRYIIQKKGLFGYHSCWLRFADICPLNLQWGYFAGCKLEKSTITFPSEREARRILDEIKNPFKEEYRGDTIIKAYYRSTSTSVYVNISRLLTCYNGFYDYSLDIDKLKIRIDEIKDKESKPTKTYIY